MNVVIYTAILDYIMLYKPIIIKVIELKVKRYQ